jgi:hypothetical protein
VVGKWGALVLWRPKDPRLPRPCCPARSLREKNSSARGVGSFSARNIILANNDETMSLRRPAVPSLLGLAMVWTSSSWSVSIQADAFAMLDRLGRHRRHQEQPITCTSTLIGGSRCRRASKILWQQQQQQEGEGTCVHRRRQTFLFLAENESGDGTDNITDDDKMLSELVRVRLEADHKRKFLTSRPRKLAYDEARTWVQRNLGVDTEDEFNDLVENGNLRTPYIPKRPQEYYTQSNDWISWDHFLRDDPDYPGVKPASGAFD